jgi:hypothetical protein
VIATLMGFFMDRGTPRYDDCIKGGANSSVFGVLQAARRLHIP